MDYCSKSNALFESFKKEYSRLSHLKLTAEDGASFNLDGSRFKGSDLTLEVASQSFDLKKVSVEHAWAYVERSVSTLVNGDLKIGLFKFPGSMEASIDITVVFREEQCSDVLDFARFAELHSL